jgi:hypothetical protein
MDEDRDELRFVACIWCGQWITKKVFVKRQQRQLDDADQCKDCRDVRKYEDSKYFRKTARTSLKLGRIECMAWNGDLDDDWNPIDDDGNLYRLSLSSQKDDNVKVEGGNIFTYEYCFRTSDAAGSVSHLYPFVTKGIISVTIDVFDYDDEGIIRIISVAKKGEVTKL